MSDQFWEYMEQRMWRYYIISVCFMWVALISTIPFFFGLMSINIGVFMLLLNDYYFIVIFYYLILSCGCSFKHHNIKKRRQREIIEQNENIRERILRRLRSGGEEF